MLDNKKEVNEIFLKSVYNPEHFVEKYKMNFKPHITIIGNKKGLKYLVDKILDYLESGDCDYDNLNFDIGPDLSDDSISMDVICEEEGFFQNK